MCFFIWYRLYCSAVRIRWHYQKREAATSLFCFRCYVLFIGDGTLNKCGGDDCARDDYEAHQFVADAKQI